MRPGWRFIWLAGNDILQHVLDYSVWQRIDTGEVARRSPNRCRQKFASIPELLNAAKL